MRLTGSRLSIDRHQPHLAHQTPNPLTAHATAFIPQDVAHLPGTEERQLHEQRIDPTHERQVDRRLAYRLVVVRRSLQLEHPALSPDAEL